MADTEHGRDDPPLSSLSDHKGDGLLQQLSALVRASDEITEALSEPCDLQRSVQLVSHQARAVADADLGVVMLTAGPNTARVAGVSGSPRMAGVVLAAQRSIAEGIQASCDPLLIHDTARDDGAPRWLADLASFGPAMFVPIGAGGAPGWLAVARARGEPVFDPHELSLLQAFASQAGLALELQEARDRERLVVSEARIRIGRDLHDRVIQRLFTTGLTLNGAMNVIGPQKGKERVQQAVDALDAIIKEIRSSIFALEQQT